MAEEIQAAYIQFKPEIADVERNFNQVKVLLNELKPGTELVVLPELAFTGYNFATTESIIPFAESSVDGKTLQFLKEQAQKHKVYIVAGFPEINHSTNKDVFK